MKGLFQQIRGKGVTWSDKAPTKKEREIVFRSNSIGVKTVKKIMSQYKQKQDRG